MSTFNELALLTGSIRPHIELPQTRFTVSDLEPPNWSPPYTSLYDDVEIQKHYFLHRNKVRQAAMHPVMLKAGQSPFANGELGRPAARDPVLLPELLGGRLLYTNI